MDIVKAFILIIFVTWFYSYILSGIWVRQLIARFRKAPAA
jgi:hypothetical protein